MEERIKKLEKLVETQQKEIEELKNDLSKIYKDLEWKIRTSSMPIDYNPCR
jgi:flagellar biosynthesis chaperone FliJ